MLDDVVHQGVITAMVLALKLGFAYIAIMWIALVYWTFRDIRRRTEDWTLVTAATLLTLAFFLPGYWLYLVMRPRLTLTEKAEERFREAFFAKHQNIASCPKCRQRTQEDFVVCPSCQTSLRSACEGCSRALLSSWRACPYCGKAVSTIPVSEPFSAEGMTGHRSRKPIHA